MVEGTNPCFYGPKYRSSDALPAPEFFYLKRKKENNTLFYVRVSRANITKFLRAYIVSGATCFVNYDKKILSCPIIAFYENK